MLYYHADYYFHAAATVSLRPNFIYFDDFSYSLAISYFSLLFVMMMGDIVIFGARRSASRLSERGRCGLKRCGKKHARLWPGFLAELEKSISSVGADIQGMMTFGLALRLRSKNTGFIASNCRPRPFIAAEMHRHHREERRCFAMYSRLDYTGSRLISRA